jgi:plastocyanin
LTSETNPNKRIGVGRYFVVAIAIILIVAAGVFAYTKLAPTPTPSSSPTPTKSPTPIPTETLTPSPTQTLTPTPTQIPDQIILPTFTPYPSSTTTQTPTPTPTPTVSQVSVTIYAGSRTGGGLGFGNSTTTIQSPGPTLTFKVGDNVTLTLINTAASTSHNWAMVDAQSATANVVFGAQVNMIPGGGTGSVTFTPTQTGNYYYICQVPGHFAAGMWGNIIVNPNATP